MTAIKSVGSVLAPYDSDQMIPVYGFGARLPPMGEVSHCFPLTLDSRRTEVFGVQVRRGTSYGGVRTQLPHLGSCQSSSNKDTYKCWG